jgi:hypothetical protein
MLLCRALPLLPLHRVQRQANRQWLSLPQRPMTAMQTIFINGIRHQRSPILQRHRQPQRHPWPLCRHKFNKFNRGSQQLQFPSLPPTSRL